MHGIYSLLLCLLLSLSLVAQDQTKGDLLERVHHAYADNNGVKIHYVTIGEGPLVVMLHGFPDYWYTWRDQMEVLKDDFQVAAMDLRGYNLSDQPKGIENYKMKLLVEDVLAVIKNLKREKAIIVGHDWGGAIAWQVAITHPEVVEKLIVCNITHPSGSSQASIKILQENGNTSYMDEFRKQTAETLPISWLSGWVKDPEAKPIYEAAFQRSDVDAMINYYKANTSTKAQRAEWLKDPVIPQLPKVKAPVLAVFGLQDQYVRKEGLNGTWDWIDESFTLVTIPEAAHFVQQDASEKLSTTIKNWLLKDPGHPSVSLEGSPLKSLSWLLGKWVRRKGNKTRYEQWTLLGKNAFEGKGYAVAEDNKAAKLIEELMLVAMGGEIFYMPKVPENDMPIAFKLISSNSEEVIFENPKHDFPQRICYRRLDNGNLKVIVGDMANQNTLEFDFSKE